MVEPALTFDAEMTVASALEYLATYAQFKQVVIRLSFAESSFWFVMSSSRLKWLLDGQAEADCLLTALSLDEADHSLTFEGASQNIPPGFVGVLLADGEVVAVSVEAAPSDSAAVRARPVPVESKADGAPVAGSTPAPLPPREIPPPQMAPPHPAPPSSDRRAGLDEKVTIVPVLYATDRDATGDAGPYGLYGSGRGMLQFGRIEVSIPPDHERGEIETPRWWKLEFAPNPDKHVTLRSARLLDRAGFLAALALDSETHAGRQALVFVHGYNVNFDAAVRRTAQIAHDLRFDGAPILYSWPSTGAVLRYTEDENNAHWTEPHFEEFLRVLLNDSALTSVHVICHSMGNRVVVETLKNLPPDIDTRKLNQLILAAPDIDADTFAQIAAAFCGRARQTTLYASSRDLALRASKMVHGYQRAGDTDPRVLIVKSISTIDASRVDTNLLGHSYIGDGTSILADVDQLIRTGAAAQERKFFLNPADLDGGRYWMFVP
jgi:esterase/lipase superfamily enzyme